MITGTKEQPQTEEAPLQMTDSTGGPRQIIGRFVAPDNGTVSTAEGDAERNGHEGSAPPRPAIALFCQEAPDRYIGGHVAQLAQALAQRGRAVHLFACHPYPDTAGYQVHLVEPAEEGDVVEQARVFTRRAGNAFLQHFSGAARVEVMAFEWSSAGVLPLIRGLRNLQGVLSLHTLERQRSDVTSETARQISEIEREAMEAARVLLVHGAATAEVARLWLPSCADRLVLAHDLFATASFETGLDPGAVKARYQVGPVDPVLLFIGDLDEPYGPDLLLRAMPAILRHHPQARLVIVGDGQMYWPLKVYARYLLLEYAIRLVGHLQDQALHELVEASDIVVVPSRTSTPWWPILAGWAARRPVVATHEAATALTEHEKDSVLVYPSENSIVWGVERVLYDADLRQAIATAGRRKLEARFGWNALAEQAEEVLATCVTR